MFNDTPTSLWHPDGSCHNWLATGTIANLWRLSATSDIKYGKIDIYENTKQSLPLREGVNHTVGKEVLPRKDCIIACI